MKRIISAIIAFVFIMSAMSVTSASAAVSKTYYLFGYINGADYACEGDYANMGEYRFDESGKLKVKFDSTSYVAVKEEHNANWYMTDGWQGDVYSVTLLNTAITGENSDKLKVPGGLWVFLTLSENGDGTLTLSCSTDDEEYYPIRTRLWDYVNTDVPGYILVPGNYWTEESLEPFLEALDRANKALDNLDSTDDELRQAYDNLIQAKNNLEVEDDEYWGKKLASLEKKCARDFEWEPEYYYQFYTKESYDAYLDIYRLSLGTLTMDVEEIKSLYNRLYEARANLVKTGEEPTTESQTATETREQETVKANTEPTTELEESMPENVDDTSIEYWSKLKRGLELECAKDFEQEAGYYYRFYTEESYNKYRSAYRLSLGTLTSSIAEIKFVYNNLLNSKNQLVKIAEEPTTKPPATTEPTETTELTQTLTVQTEAPSTANPTEAETSTASSETDPTESETAKIPSLPVTEPTTTAPTEKVTASEPAESEASTLPETTAATAHAEEATFSNPVSKKTTAIVQKTKSDKKENPAKVSVKHKSVKANKLKTKKLTYKLITVKNAKGKVYYTKLSGSKRLRLNTDNGKITIKKKTKKGTYMLKLIIDIKGNSMYRDKTFIKTIKIRVK